MAVLTAGVGLTALYTFRSFYRLFYTSPTLGRGVCAADNRQYEPVSYTLLSLGALSILSTPYIAYLFLAPATTR